MLHPLTDVTRVDEPLAAYFDRVGEVFRVFDQQDSGNVSYGVAVEGRRWFVKHSVVPRAIGWLRQAIALNRRVRHPAMPRLHHAFETRGTPPESPDGLALVYDWVPGELLYYPTRLMHRAPPDGTLPARRFRALPLPEVLRALDTIYDVHQRLAEAGYVAVDFYDGCLIYDFHGRQIYLVDLDMYYQGAYELALDRNYGSRRFMAPEEFRRGATIDQVSNVYTLGRTALLLLGDGSGSWEAFRGTAAMRRVIERATRPDRAERFPTVRAFVEAWRKAA